ncbi:hypothetical protein LA080_001587 [Diaporthe eres]|nr:hypothetical protein LA080_001587 [Diaporthe eres]
MSFGFGVGDFLAVLKLANEVRKQFANAPKEFTDISDDIESLSLALVNADFRVKDAQTLLLELQTFNNKHSVLQKDTTDGTRTKIKRFWKRASWDSNEIRDFRQRITSNVLLLNKLEQRDIHTDVKSLLQQQNEQRRSKVVDWISPIDFGNKQRDLLSERVDNISGTWMLSTEQYATWIRDGGRTLFCWGMPGGGKTMTTAMVVDHLQSLCKGDGEALVVYIYCRYQSHNQSSAQLLRSILRSLIRQSPKVPNMVINKLFEEYNAKGEALPSHQVIPAISTMLRSARSKYILIDAVDELDDDQRAILLQRLFSLKEITKVNLLLTSRQRPKATTEIFNAHFDGPSGMQGALKNLVQGLQALGTPSKIDDFLLDLDVEIRATDRDVERYLHAEQNLLLLPKCVKERPHLQEEVISSIIRVVDGMFLLAVLHLESLKRKTTVKQVKDALQNMTEPSGSHAYDRAYDDALQRIESEADELRDLAKKALKADEDNVPDIEDVLKSCAGLVTVDHESDCVRLVHNSTQEYMDRNRVSKIPDALECVEAVCLVYYNVKSKSNPGGPFYEYSEDNRWYHGKLAEQDREFRKKLVGKRKSDRLVSPEKSNFLLSMATGMERFWQQAAMKTTLQLVIQKGCETGDLDLLESFLDTSQYEKSNAYQGEGGSLKSFCRVDRRVSK